MIRTRPLNSHLAARSARPVALPPATLSGPLLGLARAFWLLMAVSAPLLFILEASAYYRSALHLQNASGMVSLRRAEWLAGLHGLGLSSTVYAVQSIASLALMAGVMYVAGLLIFVRRSNSWIALLVSFTFVTLGTDIMTGYGGLAMADGHSSLKVLGESYLTLSDFSYYALFLIPLLFPDGRFVPRWTCWLAGAFIVLLVGQSVAPGSAIDMQHWPTWLAFPINAAGFGVILLSPVYRYRRVSDVEQREQTKWVMLGLAVALGTFLGEGLLQALVPGFTATPERAVLYNLIGPTLAYIGLTFLPISFAIAILRHRLWDIELILNRALVYAALTASVVGLYVLIVVGFGTVVRAQGSTALSLLATVMVALLFHPLHVRLQRGVNRLLYGRRDDPYAVLSHLGQQLEGTFTPGAVLPSIVETAAETLKLPYVAIALAHGEEFEVAAAVGAPVDAPLELPLVYHGETIGELLLSPRAGERSFSRSEMRLLEDLARHAGVATYAVRLTSDLQQSRERLVAAREEERRRLRRDLHDGLGPALASVTLMADAARNLLGHDPASAASLLLDLKREAQAATSEIRRVVYQLRPPALDELGLVGALQEQSAQYGPGGLAVSVQASDALPQLPAAVEVAAYRIVQEALTNVVRHARARHCMVRLQLDAVLWVEVEDDGIGFDGARLGVGLTSMRERAEELGGNCSVSVLPAGGTRVRARLPMGVPDVA